MGGPVPDEPSNGELARRLDKIEILLQGLVSRAEYTIDQRHVERRLADIDRDVADLRDKHDKDVGELRKALADDGKRQGVNFRQAVYSGALPAILCAISVLLALKVGK
jgi:hypothetical protein